MFILKTFTLMSFMVTFFHIDAKPTTDLTGKDLNSIIDELVDEYPRNKGKDSIGKTISKPFHDIAQGTKGWFAGIRQSLGDFLEMILVLVALIVLVPFAIWLCQIVKECKTKRDIRRLAQARLQAKQQIELMELTGPSEENRLKELAAGNSEIFSPMCNNA